MTNFIEEMKAWQERKERFVSASTVNCPLKQIRLTIPPEHEKQLKEYARSLREQAQQDHKIAQINKLIKEFEVNNPPPRNL